MDPRAGLRRFESRAMGSPLRLTLSVGTHDRAPAEGEGDRAWQAVVDEFEAAEEVLSRFRMTSELTGLNLMAGSGLAARPSPRLRRALAAADRAHRLTDGRFDPRVLADLDRLGYRGAPLTPAAGRPGAPSDGQGGCVIIRVGRDAIALDRPVDLGGIGKGLTLRWVAAILERMGRTDFLVEAGGDLVARGRSPEGDPWRVAVEDPFDVTDALAVVDAADLAIGTSSVRVHRWSVGGGVAHHLLDPRSGEPAGGGLAAVTVAAPDPAWAEVWSKVLFIGGRRAIANEARSRGLAAWWVADDGSFEMTPAARAMTAWVATEAVVRAG